MSVSLWLGVNMKKIIISTVGTSLLTNIASKEERTKIYTNSNCSENECDKEIVELVEKLEKISFQKLKTSDSLEIKKRLSAELNGILGFYQSNPKDAEDIHYLISTDTMQGIKCANILTNYLSELGYNAQIFTPKSLNTKTKYNFDEGVKELISWCDSTLPGYKDSGYQVVFNLTGSFKSLQGYMNTIAMFYADKIIYIFESTNSELIEIPKLPIKIDTDIFTKFIDKLLLISAGLNPLVNSVTELPELMFDVIDKQVTFSVWGELVWQGIKKELLGNNLVELPSLKYSDKFKKLFTEASQIDKIKLQESLAKASKLLIENKGDLSFLKKDGGLLYENYQNKFEGGVVIGHFRINQGDRVSCTFKNNELNLRKFGRHDFVNDNP